MPPNHRDAYPRTINVGSSLQRRTWGNQISEIRPHKGWRKVNFVSARWIDQHKSNVTSTVLHAGYHLGWGRILDRHNFSDAHIIRKRLGDSQRKSPRLSAIVLRILKGWKHPNPNLSELNNIR